jgi:transcription-repair coupling factor (superfamily II helicase)
LGAGYSIAMRDLEMRGAGEMLGTRQHGMIASVGFHLYTRMLGQAVRQIRVLTGMAGGEDRLAALREIRMPGQCRSCRWRLASRLNISRPDHAPEAVPPAGRYAGRDEVQAMEDEFIDRFGALPSRSQTCSSRCASSCAQKPAGLASVAMEGEQIVMRYPPLPEGASPQAAQPGSGSALWQECLLDARLNGGGQGDGAKRLLDVLSAIIGQWQPS